MRSYEQDRRREDFEAAERRACKAVEAAYQADNVVEIMRSVALGLLREPWKAERSSVGRQRLVRFVAACHRIAARAGHLRCSDEENARYLFGELRAEFPWLDEAEAWRLQGVILRTAMEARRGAQHMSTTGGRAPLRRLTDHERYVLGAVSAMCDRAFPGEPETEDDLAAALRLVAVFEGRFAQAERDALDIKSH